MTWYIVNAPWYISLLCSIGYSIIYCIWIQESLWWWFQSAVMECWLAFCNNFIFIFSGEFWNFLVIGDESNTVHWLNHHFSPTYNILKLVTRDVKRCQPLYRGRYLWARDNSMSSWDFHQICIIDIVFACLPI